MTIEQLEQLADKPSCVEDCIAWGQVIGLSEEECALYYFHYDSFNWVITREDGALMAIRNWKSYMGKWKVKSQILNRQAAAKLEHWKQQDARRQAERSREYQLRAKEGQKVAVAISHDGWNDYAWYLEQVQVYGAKVNDRLIKSEREGQPVWRYK